MKTIFINIPGAPPRATGQMRKATAQSGKIRFYEPPDVKAAREYFMLNLRRGAAERSLTGPIKLTVDWCFPANGRHKDGDWKTTRPDTDNLQKLFKDCLTKSGYWRDDAQVCWEIVRKTWSDKPRISVEIKQLEGWRMR